MAVSFNAMLESMKQAMVSFEQAQISLSALLEDALCTSDDVVTVSNELADGNMVSALNIRTGAGPERLPSVSKSLPARSSKNRAYRIPSERIRAASQQCCEVRIVPI